jgi:hypothetical protein
MSVMVLGNKVDLVQPKDRSTLESNGKCVPLHSGESLAKVCGYWLLSVFVCVSVCVSVHCLPTSLFVSLSVHV